SPLPPTDQTGGRKRWESEPLSGLYGAMRSAKTAANTSTSRMPIGKSGRPSRRMRGIRQAIGADATGLGLGAGLTLIADPRVDDGVEEIDHQVDDHDHGAGQQHGGLHHR